MKFVSFLTHATLVTSVAFLLAVVTDVQALTLFGVATSTFMLLIAARDYLTPRRSLAAAQVVARSGGPARRSKKYTLPFAA